MLLDSFIPASVGWKMSCASSPERRSRRGQRVRVVTLDRLFSDTTQHKLPARETLDGIEIVRIPYFGSSRYPVALSVLRHIKDADLVHVHAIDFFFDYLAWTKPLHGRTLVVSTHGGFFHTDYAALLKRVWFQTVTRLSLKFYAGVAAVSASDFERFSSIRSSGMVCIENGANVSTFHDASADNFQKSIISIGRFAKNKRIDLLIEFARALRRHDPEWRLTIAGRPGDLQTEDVSALVENAGLDDAVDVVASPTDETVKTLMRSSSFVASSSEYEGFGVAAVEGMSAGLVPSAERNSAVPPAHRPHRAWHDHRLFASGRGRAAPAAELAEDRIELCGATRRVHAGSRAYDWPGVCQEYSKLYDAAIGSTVRTILDVPVQVRTFDEAVELIDARYARREQVAVAFANAHTLNVAAENPEFRVALQNALVFNDGIGVDIASRLLYGSPFPENLNGTDFGPNYLRATKHRYRIFLLGAKPGTAERAAAASFRIVPATRRSSVVITATSMRASLPRSSISFATPRPTSCLWRWAIPNRSCSSRITLLRRDASSAWASGPCSTFLPATSRARRLGYKDGVSNGSIAWHRSRAVSRAATLSAILCS